VNIKFTSIENTHPWSWWWQGLPKLGYNQTS